MNARRNVKAARCFCTWYEVWKDMNWTGIKEKTTKIITDHSITFSK